MDKPVALVTGAGRGIGRATAVEMGKRGYRLGLVSRTAGQLEETRALCGGGEVIAGDVSAAEDVNRIVAEAMDRLGRVDVLINAAGMVVSRSIEQMSLEEWHRTIDTNLSPVFYFCRLLWPIWRKQGGGAVVNVSSFASRDPFPGIGAYGAAKAGMNLLGMSLAREGAAIGVRVHTVAPAGVETEMLRSLMTVEQCPTEKTLDPKQVAAVIAQCACGDLAVTSGEVVYVHKNL
jgi:NAD(P)-dependent dehydrogenase (short-subunit alcohol dehydrogenase family)